MKEAWRWLDAQRSLAGDARQLIGATVALSIGANPLAARERGACVTSAVGECGGVADGIKSVQKAKRSIPKMEECGARRTR